MFHCVIDGRMFLPGIWLFPWSKVGRLSRLSSHKADQCKADQCKADCIQTNWPKRKKFFVSFFFIQIFLLFFYHLGVTWHSLMTFNSPFHNRKMMIFTWVWSSIIIWIKLNSMKFKEWRSRKGNKERKKDDKIENEKFSIHTTRMHFSHNNWIEVNFIEFEWFVWIQTVLMVNY